MRCHTMCHRNTTEEFVYHYEKEGERYKPRDENESDADEELLAEADD